jgi:glycerol-3-phosphate acyltransferase PlsY
MEYLISSVIGYLLGSIPTAYLLLKKTKGIDITSNGSGNVGALNSFRISKSKLLGLLVLLIDFGKGALSALVLVWIYPGHFIYPALAVLFAVLAHCYVPWLEFRGGRGLAAAAGGAAVIFPFLLVVWLILWVIFYLMKRNIIFSNIGATILSLMLVYSIDDIAIKYAYPKPETVSSLILISASVLIIIFIKHIEPLKELINELKTKRVLNDKD